MRIDWLSKLQHLLQTMAFCLAIATIQYAFPRAALCATGGVFGVHRHFYLGVHRPGARPVPVGRETGWPQGMAGVAAGGRRHHPGTCWARHWPTSLPHLWLVCRGMPVDRTANLRNSILITVLAGHCRQLLLLQPHKGAYLERKMVEARQHANEARLKLLETQLEPHMLFNTLANLRVLIGTDPHVRRPCWTT
jgi:hypothetical protein